MTSANLQMLFLILILYHFILNSQICEPMLFSLNQQFLIHRGVNLILNQT